MTTAQKIIKYCAIAFAIFLIVTIISGILSGIYGLASAIGLKKGTTNETGSINLEGDLTAYLDVDVAYSNLNIKVGKEFLAQTNNENIQCKQDGNRLKIKEKNLKWFAKDSDGNLTIYIPEDLKLEEIKINTGAGKVNIESLMTQKLRLNLGAGEVRIGSINADEADIDTGAGKFTIESGNINNLDFDMGVGETNLTAKITGKSEIDTGIGAFTLKLLESEEYYKFKVNKGIGDITIGGKSISDNQKIGNGENFIDISGGIGKIKIDFE